MSDIFNSCLICKQTGQGLFCGKCHSIGITRCEKTNCNTFHLVTTNCHNCVISNRTIKRLTAECEQAIQLSTKASLYFNSVEESANNFRQQLSDLKKAIENKTSYDHIIKKIYDGSNIKPFIVSVYHYESGMVHDITICHGMSAKIVYCILSLVMKDDMEDMIIEYSGRPLDNIIKKDITDQSMLVLKHIKTKVNDISSYVDYEE